ncbi:MAG TPA: hypothetical protein RMH80_29200 [Polyangiaceae bacterium LLY-WYZ-15_(1-7)]|nr:hypothetical protein [Polyangiaceae bacterium LLY-WYZ-15_(1-7)]
MAGRSVPGGLVRGFVLVGVLVTGVLAASVLAGCGAKTGLLLPDAQVDAGEDAGVDASFDAGTDAGMPPPCIELPPDGGPVRTSFELPVSLAVVDVMFLLDATASMLDEIDTIRRRLRDRVVPGVTEAIPDAWFGVALVGEFPVEPHGPGDVRPYEMRAPLTDDLIQIEAALGDLPTWGNFDEPEAQVEGLYQVATGEGLRPWIEASAGCPRGGIGGGCFRREALPVVVLITDAPMNNGPPGVRPESEYDFAGPHEYGDAVRELRRLGALVIGLGARDAFAMSPMRHLRAIAEDTGAVEADRTPIAIDIGGTGSGVGSGIVEAIQRLAEGTPLDVDAQVEDVPGDAIDARDLVVAIRPLSAEPMSGVGEVTEDAFLDVRPGTRVTFEIELDGSRVPPAPETRLVPARVLFRANRRSRLGREEVVFLIPGEDGGSCDELAR